MNDLQHFKERHALAEENGGIILIGNENKCFFSAAVVISDNTVHHVFKILREIKPKYGVEYNQFTSGNIEKNTDKYWAIIHNNPSHLTFYMLFYDFLPLSKVQALQSPNKTDELLFFSQKLKKDDPPQLKNVEIPVQVAIENLILSTLLLDHDHEACYDEANNLNYNFSIYNDTHAWYDFDQFLDWECSPHQTFETLKEKIASVLSLIFIYGSPYNGDINLYDILFDSLLEQIKPMIDKIQTDEWKNRLINAVYVSNYNKIKNWADFDTDYENILQFYTDYAMYAKTLPSKIAIIGEELRYEYQLEN